MKREASDTVLRRNLSLLGIWNEEDCKPCLQWSVKDSELPPVYMVMWSTSLVLTIWGLLAEAAGLFLSII